MSSPGPPTTDGAIASSAMRGGMSRLRVLFLAVVGLLAATLGSLLMLAVAIGTLFRARRFYSEVMAKSLGRFALWLCEVELVVHGDRPLSETQTVYVSNHTSTLDVFVLIAMGLPNTRFFMYGKLRRILPVGLIGYLIGIFWTVDQCYPERRRNIFERAARVLRRTGESVYLSPEGQRVVTGEIGHFNKGSFHMATDLQTPIQPFYIRIPQDIDPGTGLVSGAGRVDVYFMPQIDTDDWRVEDVEENRDHVRDLFVQFHEKMKQP
jgi:1-acyl-sn-glycerol-3-phosphate acyltransferase